MIFVFKVVLHGSFFHKWLPLKGESLTVHIIIQYILTPKSHQKQATNLQMKDAGLGTM